MPTSTHIKEHFIEELKTSPLELVKEVYDYFEFLKVKYRTHEEEEGFIRLSESSFHKIWDNEVDAIYDRFLQEV